MKLLVTGGSGFLGGYVLRAAVQRGHQVVALARSAAAASTVASLGGKPLTGDFDAPGQLRDAFVAARCDALVNLASLGFGHGPTIVTAAQQAGISRAIFISTTAVTTSLPAATKRVRLEAEQWIRASELSWTILRPTMIYGAPGDRNLSRLLTLLARTLVLPVPCGRQLQQPVHVVDVAGAVLNAVEMPRSAGQCYDVAGPEPLAFSRILRISAEVISSRTWFVPVPITPVVAIARGYERLSRHPRIRTEQVLRLAEDKAFAIDAAVRDLDYSPRPFATGIRAEAEAMGLAR